MRIKEIDIFRVLTCLQLFCHLFWILVCNSYESERSGKTVYVESVESISFFMAYTLGAYICLHNTHFPSDYNGNQASICYKDSVARLLHKYAYSLVKYSQNVA